MGLIYPNVMCWIRPLGIKVEFVFLGRIDMVHKGLDILLLDALRILCDEGWHSYVHFSFYGAPDNPGDFLTESML